VTAINFRRSPISSALYFGIESRENKQWHIPERHRGISDRESPLGGRWMQPAQFGQNAV